MMSGDLDGADSRLDDAETALAAGAQDEDLAATWADTAEICGPRRRRSRLPRGAGPSTRRCRRHRAPCPAPWTSPDQGPLRTRWRQRLSRAGRLGRRERGRGAVHVLDAVRSLQAAGNFVDALDTTIPLGDMWVAAGKPSRARRLYEQALQTVTANGPPYPRATADLHTGLAEARPRAGRPFQRTGTPGAGSSAR